MEQFQSDYINIVDSMAAVRKLKVNSNVTFREMSEKLLYNILKTSKDASQIHFVFDVYKSDSITNAERVRRSSGQLQFRNIVAKQKIKQCNQLKTSKNASQIHVVFDVYKSDSIKNAERIRRSSGQLQFCNIVATQKIKQWNQFLSSGDNKMQLIDFIVNRWQYDERILKMDPNIFYATTG